MKPTAKGLKLEGRGELGIAGESVDFASRFLADDRQRYLPSIYSRAQTRLAGLRLTLANYNEIAGLMMPATEGVVLQDSYNVDDPRSGWLLSCLKLAAVIHPDETVGAAAQAMLEDSKEPLQLTA